MEQPPINQLNPLENNELPKKEGTNESIELSEEEKNILQKQKSFNEIQKEIEFVIIEEKDRDVEGNLLAPNGKKSHLPEKEWKMTRTPSFIKIFGNWKEKYNKEQYELWLKYQEKQTCEDYIKRYQTYKEDKKNQSLQVLENIRKDENNKEQDNNEKWTEYHLKQIKGWEDFYQKDIIRLSHKISKLQAELINSDFNTHSNEWDYTKVLDENGEPILLFRGTDFSPNEEGKFIIPKKNIDGNDFEVGVFFGKESEAKIHHEGRVLKGKETKMYKAFVNGRNFRVFDSKPNYWNDPKDTKDWQEKYDGLWVKENAEETTHSEKGINMMDYVVFNPDEILIVGIE